MKHSNVATGQNIIRYSKPRSFDWYFIPFMRSCLLQVFFHSAVHQNFLLKLQCGGALYSVHILNINFPGSEFSNSNAVAIYNSL